MASHLLAPDRRDWKAAGVLVYSFTADGRLRLLLGRACRAPRGGYRYYNNDCWTILGARGAARRRLPSPRAARAAGPANPVPQHPALAVRMHIRNAALHASRARHARAARPGMPRAPTQRAGARRRQAQPDRRERRGDRRARDDRGDRRCAPRRGPPGGPALPPRWQCLPCLAATLRAPSERRSKSMRRSAP